MKTARAFLPCLLVFLALTVRALPAPLPLPETLPADNITTNSATLHGASVWNKKQPGYVAFQIRKAGARWPVKHTPWQRVARSTTNIVFAADVANLLAGTNYQFRTVRYIAGVTRYGNTLSFTATNPPPTAPSVVTMPATTFPAAPPALVSPYAYLKGTVNPKGNTATVFFQWGTTTNYGNTLAAPNVSAGNSNVPVQSFLYPLAVATTYHFRIVAYNVAGTNFGENLSFTSHPDAPAVATFGAAGIIGGSATLLGDVNPGGGETAIHFDWGTTTSYGNSTDAQPIPAATAFQRVGATISGLTIGDTYHFRLVASNSAGLRVGQDFSFSTGCAGSPSAGTVTNCTEADLRAAIASGLPVQFACAGTIGLTSPITISNTVSLDACDQPITVSGNNQVRHFHVTESGSLHLHNVTLAFGRASSPGQPADLLSSASGGSVLSLGAFQAEDCRFVSNSVIGGAIGQSNGRGGAICAATGSVELARSEFNFNTAEQGYADGGAIYVEQASVKMTECSFASNQATGGDSPYVGGFGPFIGAGYGRGGAILNLAGGLVVNRCIWSNNSAKGGAGWEYLSPFRYAEDGSGLGGAIYNGGVMAMTNCTLFGNQVGVQLSFGFVRPTSLVAGGAVYNSGLGWIAFSTIASNRALPSAFSRVSLLGGGCLNTNGTLSLSSSLFSGNTAFGYENATGPMLDLGHNLSSDATPVWTSGTSLNNADPLLGPLSNNGGFTLTFPLLLGSPAIDAADPLLAPATDQRGVARPQGPAPDIGSYER